MGATLGVKLSVLGLVPAWRGCEAWRALFNSPSHKHRQPAAKACVVWLLCIGGRLLADGAVYSSLTLFAATSTMHATCLRGPREFRIGPVTSASLHGMIVLAMPAFLALHRSRRAQGTLTRTR